MKINCLIKGNKKFREVSFPEYKEDLKTLVEHGQNPEILFIGCSDSRVVPNLILDAQPGDMFILRNVGNFVPPFRGDADFHGSSAVIEYAVSILSVKDIIICGHSHCGACRSLYKEIPDSDAFIHVKSWLELGKSAKEEALLTVPDPSNRELLYQTTEKISILHQIENIMTFPEVARKVKEGTLTVHGWYYHIENGAIEYYDGEVGDFKPLL